MYPSLLFIAFIVTFSSNSVLSYALKDNGYCKLPFTCGKGGISIDYPFGHDVRGYYCGYPGLRVDCTDKKPVISLANHLYYVKDLDYSIRRLVTVVGMDVEGKKCPQPANNLTDIGLPTPLYVVANFNVSIFYNCSNYLANMSHIACLEFQSTKRSYAFSGNNPLQKFDWHKNCEKNIVLPLYYSTYSPKKGLLADSNYTKTLQSGFQLGWSTPSECLYCESAGGVCSVPESLTTSNVTCAIGPVGKPSNKGTTIDLGFAYALILVTLVLAYLIQPLDASSYSLF